MLLTRNNLSLPHSWRWLGHQPTRFGRWRFRFGVRWFGHGLAHEHRPALVLANAGLCLCYKYIIPFTCGAQKVIFELLIQRSFCFLWFHLHNRWPQFKPMSFSCVFFFFCIQGDLDRQRLLGNRQRTGVYESVIDDGIEGIEHQERWIAPPRFYFFIFVFIKISVSQVYKT